MVLKASRKMSLTQKSKNPIEVQDMDIKGKIEEIIAKVKNDPGFAAKFTSNPVQAVESIIGVDLPDDQVKAVVDGVKAKVSLDSAGDVLGSIKKLF